MIANKLITAMLQESNLDGWEAIQCVAMRQAIERLVPELRRQSESTYRLHLKEQETLDTFYGSYLSDDSDDEEAFDFELMSEVEKAPLKEKGERYRQRAQADSIVYKKKTGEAPKGSLRISSDTSSVFDLKARTVIHHGPQVDQAKVVRDLDHLNILLSRRGYTIEKAVAELSEAAQKRGETFTQFYLAEFRGVTHDTSRWNQESRRAHRKDPDELGKRQYSASIYMKAGLSLFRDYTATKEAIEQNPQLLDEPAEELREVLLTFREPRPYAHGHYTYSNLAYLLQNIYTENYKGFHELLLSDPILSSIFFNGGNPYTSMGDTPYHACKYAFGLKAYLDNKKFTLAPRWHKDGRLHCTQSLISPPMGHCILSHLIMMPKLNYALR
jgi:hypothetical protein